MQEFTRTRRGQVFINKTMPAIAHNLGRIATALEAIAQKGVVNMNATDGGDITVTISNGPSEDGKES